MCTLSLFDIKENELGRTTLLLDSSVSWRSATLVKGNAVSSEISRRMTKDMYANQ
jgi:hypothetical protein